MNSIKLYEMLPTMLVNNDVEEAIKIRESQKESNVDISDSLVDKYNVEIFNEDDANLNNKYNSEELFIDESNLDNASLSKTYSSIFTEDVNYHQGVQNQVSSNYLIVGWLVIIVMVSVVLSKIVNIKRKNANKNRINN